jgi:hypothetical protein
MHLEMESFKFDFRIFSLSGSLGEVA